MSRLLGRSFSLLCAFFLLAVAPKVRAADPPSADDLERVDLYLAAQLERLAIPGAAIAIVMRTGEVHTRGFGTTGAAPVTSGTPFILGSVSKSITALAVMQLVAASKIDLDAPVTKYLPWFQAIQPEESTRMTVRHLLNQTSGFTTREGRTHFHSDDASDTALDSRIRDLKRAHLRHGPGAAFEYSNANYDLAGAIVQAVSGQSYEKYVDEHVFAPLNMSQSFSSRTAAQAQGLVPGHRYWFGHPVQATSQPYPRCMVASGYLISSASDMAKLLLLHVNRGKSGAGSLFSPASVDELHRPAAAVSDRVQYGMGWFVENVQGQRLLWHSGSVPDFHAHVAIAPEAGWAFALLLNAENYVSGPDIDKLGGNVRRLLMRQEPRAIKEGAGLLTPALAVLACLLIVQMLAAAHTLHVSRRWREQRRNVNWSRGLRIWRFFVPPTVSLCIVVILFLAGTMDTPFVGLWLFAPDAALLLACNAAFAILWAVVRSIVVLRRCGPLPNKALQPDRASPGV